MNTVINQNLMILDQEHVVQEYSRCFKDKTRIYMIEHYLKIQNGNEGGITPFLLMPRQKEWLVNCSQNEGNITLKCRQSGYTTTSAAKIACEMVLASEDNPINVLVIAQNFDKAKENTKLILEMIRQLPYWFFDFKLNPKTTEEKRKVWRTIMPEKTKTYIQLMNGSQLFCRSSSPTASNGIPAVSILFCDEAALFQDGLACFSEAVRTTSTVKNKLIMLVSTPYGKDSFYYEYYSNAMMGVNGYKITESRWTDDSRYNKNLKFYKDVEEGEEGDKKIERKWIVIPTIDEQGNVQWDPDKWKQLEGEGWRPTSPWYIKACNENNNDKRTIAQSIECSFVGSDSIAVDPDIIDMHKNLNVKTDFATDPLQPKTWIWKPALPGHRYILGIDGSRSDGNDSATIEILDVDAIDEQNNHYIEQVLEFVSKTPMDIVGEIAFKYATVYNNALIVADAIGGYSDAAILTLMRLNYKNLYYDNNSSDYLSVDSKNTLIAPGIDGRLPGFRTKSARTYMIENFINKLRENFLRIRSTRVISELETWVVVNGKVDHKRGKHDDTLMNLTMSLFVFESSFTKLEKQRNLDNQILDSFFSTLQLGSSKPELSPDDSRLRNTYKYAPTLYTTKTAIPQKQQDIPYGWLFN